MGVAAHPPAAAFDRRRTSDRIELHRTCSFRRDLLSCRTKSPIGRPPPVADFSYRENVMRQVGRRSRSEMQLVVRKRRRTGINLASKERVRCRERRAPATQSNGNVSWSRSRLGLSLLAHHPLVDAGVPRLKRCNRGAKPQAMQADVVPPQLAGSRITLDLGVQLRKRLVSNAIQPLPAGVSCNVRFTRRKSADRVILRAF